MNPEEEVLERILINLVMDYYRRGQDQEKAEEFVKERGTDPGSSLYVDMTTDTVRMVRHETNIGLAVAAMARRLKEANVERLQEIMRVERQLEVLRLESTWRPEDQTQIMAIPNTTLLHYIGQIVKVMWDTDCTMQQVAERLGVAVWLSGFYYTWHFLLQKQVLLVATTDSEVYKLDRTEAMVHATLVKRIVVAAENQNS